MMMFLLIKSLIVTSSSPGSVFSSGLLWLVSDQYRLKHSLYIQFEECATGKLSPHLSHVWETASAQKLLVLLYQVGQGYPGDVVTRTIRL